MQRYLIIVDDEETEPRSGARRLRRIEDWLIRICPRDNVIGTPTKEDHGWWVHPREKVSSNRVERFHGEPVSRSASSHTRRVSSCSIDARSYRRLNFLLDFCPSELSIKPCRRDGFLVTVRIGPFYFLRVA